MRALGCLFAVIITFVVGLFAGLYLAGHGPEELVKLIEEKIQGAEKEISVPSPTPISAPVMVEVYNTAPVGLRVRATPLTEEGNVLGKVFDGTRFSVTGGPEKGGGFEWLKVRLEGWVAANWLSPVPAVGTTVAVKGTGIGLRVREAPLINNNIAGKVYDGTKLLVLKGPASGSGYQWWKVRLEGWSARQYLRKPTPAPTATKADLVQALKELREASLKKINSDIGTISTVFTDVKDYARSKRVADILRAPLVVMEGTLILLAKANDLTSLADKVNTSLDKAEAPYQVLSTVAMVQDLQQVGEKLSYALYGPPYVKAIEDMLKKADATFIPPFGDDWQRSYKDVIESHLWGVAKASPLIIPHKSTTVKRENIEVAKGALKVRNSISRRFNDLIDEVENRELPENFPIIEVIFQVNSLKKQVVKSRSHGTEVEYKTHFQDRVETNLGAIGELDRAFGQVSRRLDKKLKIEQHIEVCKVMETGESAALLCAIIYEIPGVKKPIRVVQKATVLAELSLKSHERTFYTNVEEKFYMLPQEMVLSLPTELSNLWMIADDTCEHIAYLLRQGGH